MKGDVRAFGRFSKKNHIDMRLQCGRLEVRADDAGDARLLALLYRVLFNVCVNPGVDQISLYKYLRTQVKNPEDFPEEPWQEDPTTGKNEEKVSKK